ncbi:MAG TPA: response regulator [Gammaproteobacteria bacterium]
MTNKNLKYLPILLVEDDQIDTETVKRILKKEHIVNPLFCATDGVEALEILQARNSQKDITQPCVILLDINMPRMNGLEFLEEIRQHEVLKQNITFILTTSARNEDMVAAYNLSVAGYILKENMGRLVELLGEYCQINEVPS